MFRFSLRTLVVVALWVGTVMAIGIRREPWTLAQKALGNHDSLKGNWYFLQVRDSRQIMIVSRPVDSSRIEITEIPSGRGVYVLHIGGNIVGIRFNSADEIEVNQGQYISRFTCHYPEWWWGHFYRPEVWLLMVLSLTLGVTFVRHVRARRGRRV